MMALPRPAWPATGKVRCFFSLKTMVARYRGWVKTIDCDPSLMLIVERRGGRTPIGPVSY